MCFIIKGVLKLSFVFNLSTVTGIIYSYYVVTRSIRNKTEIKGKYVLLGWYLLYPCELFILMSKRIYFKCWKQSRL